MICRTTSGQLLDISELEGFAEGYEWGNCVPLCHSRTFAALPGHNHRNPSRWLPKWARSARLLAKQGRLWPNWGWNHPKSADLVPALGANQQNPDVAKTRSSVGLGRLSLYRFRPSSTPQAQQQTQLQRSCMRATLLDRNSIARTRALDAPAADERAEEQATIALQLASTVTAARWRPSPEAPSRNDQVWPELDQNRRPQASNRPYLARNWPHLARCRPNAGRN